MPLPADFKPKFIPKKERERLAREAAESAAKQPAPKPKPKPAPQKTGKWSLESVPEGMTAKEWEERKEKYLGPVQKSTFSAAKKRKRASRDEFKFDWDLSEDTWRGDDDQGRDRGWELRLAFLKEKYPERVEEETRKHEEALRKEANKYNRDLAIFGPHWSEKPLDQMRSRDWRIFKDDFQISTTGSHIPNPMRSWSESGLPRNLLDIVRKLNYRDPTPIQRAAIPIALQNRDLIGVAVTGSGKTASFLLPLLVYISDLPALNESNKHDGPYGLILAPTRELAQQIESEARKFAFDLGYTCVSIVGGHSMEAQAQSLANGAEIVVATPGRLVDCLERHLLVLSQCSYLILDEADRMIDLGFEESLNKILAALPATNEKPDTEEAENGQLMSRYLFNGGAGRYRQTMMYTATMPSAVEKIAQKYLRRPATVKIGSAGEANDMVEQRVEFINGEDRRKKRLEEILRSGEFAAPIIVFVNIKRNCDAVARDIKHMGFETVALHGGKTQDQREAALGALRRGTAEVLVATDVAGRGIDVPDVSLVVNFNMALTIDAFKHRVGRTGRAGKRGVAVTFIGNEDADVMYDLRQTLVKAKQKVPDELRRHEASQQKPMRNIRN